MKITNLSELEAAKELFKEKLADLHKSNEDLLIYAPQVAGQVAPRHLYIVPDGRRMFTIQESLDQLENIKNAISDFYGDNKRRNNLTTPALLKNVAMIRIWLNNAISSRRISRQTILNRLTKYVEIANRYTQGELADSASKLQAELDFFKASNEANFTLRSIAAQDVTLRIYFENNDEERRRLTSAGLFVAGKDYQKPKILKPTEDSVSAREGIYEKLTPIPYSGAPSALLYRVSDAELEKNRVKFDQDGLTDSKKAKPRAPKKAQKA